MRTRLSDGLTKTQRYRLRDLEGYRQRKREYARTPVERAKRRAYMALWREKNRARHNALARESHQRNKHKHVARARADHLKRSYGITVDTYQTMLAAQNGVCAICQGKPTTRALSVDHDHKTGQIRQLLCTPCNTKLGWFERHRKTVTAYLNPTELVW